MYLDYYSDKAYEINTIEATNNLVSISSDLTVMGCSVAEAITALEDLQKAFKSLTSRVEHTEADIGALQCEQEVLRSYIEPVPVAETENPKQKSVLEILSVKMDEIYKNILDFDFMPQNMFLN